MTKDYASIHNKGGTIKITEKMRKYFYYRARVAKNKQEKKYFINLANVGSKINIPQREFIGDSKKLTRKIKIKIMKELNNVYNG